MGFHRTTVVLDERLYRQVKQTALQEDRTIREVVQQALEWFCQGRMPARSGRKMPRFGAYPSRVIGDISRSSIYEERI